MRCAKCQGCLVPEIQEYPLPETVKCINCAWRENKPLPIPPRDPYSRKDRCLNCQESCEAGYKQCPKCRAYQRRYRNSGKPRNRTGPILPVVLLVEKP